MICRMVSFPMILRLTSQGHDIQHQITRKRYKFTVEDQFEVAYYLSIK